MSEQKKRTSKRELITRIVCGILALLMIGGIATYSIVFLFFR